MRSLLPLELQLTSSWSARLQKLSTARELLFGNKKETEKKVENKEVSSYYFLCRRDLEYIKFFLIELD